jgi:hypothetical protein
MLYGVRGFAANVPDLTSGVHAWFDHDKSGGTGIGPVANGQNHYDQAFYVNAAACNSAVPSCVPQNVTGSNVHYTNDVANNCGSHNCFGVDSMMGATTYDHNSAGEAEHNQFDMKCAFNGTETNNYAHDSYLGPITNDTHGEAFYEELDWDSCSGGTVLFQNNTASNVENGMFCNVNINSGGDSQTCHMYNNTIAVAPVLGLAGFFNWAHAGETLTLDVENNIVYQQDNGNGNTGFQTSSSNNGTYNITEQYNGYYNATGPNQNDLKGTNYNTLALWQAQGVGQHDVWQVDPLLTDAANNLIPLCSTSPMIGVGNPAIGTSSTLGADPTPISCSRFTSQLATIQSFAADLELGVKGPQFP